MNSERTYGSIVHSDLPYLRLDIPPPDDAVLAEAASRVAHFVDHREGEVPDGRWQALALHGLGSDKTLGFEAYGVPEAGQADAYRWTDAADLCPATTAYVKASFPEAQFGRVRLMLLRPGGRIPFHADYSERKLASISIALNHPAGCRFLYRDRGEVHEVPFVDGRAFAVNLSYEHSVVNEGSVDRFHLIVHVLRGNARLRELFLRSFARHGDPRVARVEKGSVYG